MRRTLPLLALALFAAAPAAAQPDIIPGQTVTGALSAADPTLDDKSHYDVWRFTAEPAHVYHVVLRSAEFDAFLAVGQNVGDRCTGCDTDDDGGGGTDAELRFTAMAGGTYEIRANSYDADETGAYTLLLEDEGPLPAPDTVAAPGMVVLGGTTTGRLERGDEKTDNGSLIDTYTYWGRRNEVIVITLHSDEFDTYLRVGEVEHGGCRPVQGDDNGGGGTDSRLRVRLPSDGEFHIHVQSARRGATGTYTLTVVPG